MRLDLRSSAIEVLAKHVPKGGDRRPIFILGDFVEAFVGGRRRFEEVDIEKAILFGVRTAGFRLVLGWFSAGSRLVLGWSSAGSRRVLGKISARFRVCWRWGPLLECWKALLPDFYPKSL